LLFKSIEGYGQDYDYEQHLQNKIKETLLINESENLLGDENAKVSRFVHVILEDMIREACELFDRRLRLYSPLVGSLLLMAESESDAFEGVQKLVPLQDALQAFEIEVRGAREALLAVYGDEDSKSNLSSFFQIRSKLNNGNENTYEKADLKVDTYNRQWELDDIMSADSSLFIYDHEANGASSTSVAKASLELEHLLDDYAQRLNR
jgi:hypothetical protein